MILLNYVRKKSATNLSPSLFFSIKKSTSKLLPNGKKLCRCVNNVCSCVFLFIICVHLKLYISSCNFTHTHVYIQNYIQNRQHRRAIDGTVMSHRIV